MTAATYTQAYFKKCSINNIDISLHIRKLYVSCSILTPYIVAEITIVDATSLQDSLYEPGSDVVIVYGAGDSPIVREYNLVTMGNMGGTKSENNRSGTTKIVAVSKCYFDMQNEHSSYHQNIPASEVFKKLHKELVPGSDVNVTKTRGLIGDIEPFHLRGIKLGRALNMVRNRMTDEKYKSGAYVYYIDQNESYHCVPIQQLFETAAGPRFTQRVQGLSFLKEQQTLAYNIVSMRRGSTDSFYGSDNATDYQSALRQRGGNVNEGWDWASGTYTMPSSKDYDPQSLSTPGKSVWRGGSSTAPGTVNHRFGYDSNQKMNVDYEADIANRNLIKSMIMQGSTLVNVPLEGGMNSYVGGGCYLDILSDIGEFDRNSSLYGGQHLVIAQGEYIFQDGNGLLGIAALQTASGGKQGSLV